MAREPSLGSVPRQQRGVDARDRVYAAAIDQFALHGVAATRVEDVTAAAGVAWGTFFRYFPRKEDVLLHAARRHHEEQLLPLVDGGLADPAADARPIALALFLALLCPAGRTARLHGATLREITRNRDRFLAVLGDRPSTDTLVQRIIEHGKAQGSVRADAPTPLLSGVLITATVFTTLYGYFDAAERDPDLLLVMPSPEPMITGAFGVAWRGLEATP